MKDMTKWEFFRAGWRPAMGWASVAIIIFSFLVHPMLLWYSIFAGIKVTVDVINATALLNLVGIVIGVGAMRTIEKINNKEDENL